MLWYILLYSIILSYVVVLLFFALSIKFNLIYRLLINCSPPRLTPTIPSKIQMKKFKP